MIGQFTVDPTYIKTSAFSSLNQKVMYRPAGSTGSAGTPGGGGSFGAFSNGVGSNVGSVSSSRNVKYTITLPLVLPPSHRGKVVRFFYKLIVGIQRAGKVRQSQIITIPFRLFNRTNYNGTRPLYEIMNPVIVNKDEATVSVVPQGIHKTAIGTPLSPVSYEICKNNEHVAQLTLPRTSYRLGETITAVLNFTNGSIPCHQVSVYLESIENVEPPFLVKTKHQTTSHTRRCHTEVHRSTLNTRRLTVSITIPWAATADFQSTAVSMLWSLRIEFVTGKTGQLVIGDPANVDDPFLHQRGVRTVEVEPFDCPIPLKVFGGGLAVRRGHKKLQFEI
eukprot:jgi/Hompol1/5503/HPOL_004481-RA